MIIQVLVPYPFDHPFSYSVPAAMEVKVGMFMKVPLGKRVVIGVVWSLEQEEGEYKIKPIEAIVDGIMLPATMIAFIKKTADYNVVPLGLVLKMVLSSAKAIEQPDVIYYYQLTEDYKENLKKIRSSKSREQVIEILENKASISAHDFKKEYKVSKTVLNGLVKEKILLLHEQPKVICDLEGSLQAKEVTLSKDQAQAAGAIIETFDEGYACTVLDGVTGSGKTEVYFKAIEKILMEDSGQVLVLFPEIVLTAQMIERFKKRFGFTPSVWHSGVSQAKRRNTWRGVAEGGVRLIIGARSALYLPFKELKLIVVDEEHEATYKQEEGVAYHGRDMAVFRAFIEQIPIILASATPSLETMVNVYQKKYHHVHLPNRHGVAEMPDLHIIDMCKESISKGTWVSPTLRDAIKETVQNGKQAMLFLNRRGYAPLTLCRSCGYKFECSHCSSWLVMHQSSPYLHCHHCGYRTRIPKDCPSCEEKDSLMLIGPGVERIVEEVSKFMPDARIAMMTSDTVSNQQQAEELVADIGGGKVDIIIGTQMMAKGHHFPALALVGVIDADFGLIGGDPRASERTYQLLHQVSGRAGREATKGKVYLQSAMPDNAIVQALVNESRDSFIQHEMTSRELNQLPPYTRLVSIVFAGKREQEVIAIARKCVQLFPRDDRIMVLGPTPANMTLLRGKYRYRVFIRVPKQFAIQQLIRQVMEHLKAPSSVGVRVDVDPYSFH